jgi:2-phosphosulfolactate phosphatase
MESRQIELCYSPALFHLYEGKGKTVVVVDIFRATTAICAAFDHGVKRIIPVAGLEEARGYKDKGYLIAAERDGIKPDFAHFGNSPFNFMQQGLDGATIVYSTTNGTQAIQRAAVSSRVVIASFINISATARHLAKGDGDVTILCSGWKERFSLEDALFGGALADMLIENHGFISQCDSVTAARDLWHLAKDDLIGYKEKFAHTYRLRRLMLDDAIEFCLTPDQSEKVPLFIGGAIVCDETPE